MTGPVTAPAGVTVLYSTSNDPCRPELNYNPPGCVNGSFSPTPPSPISSVASLEFSYPARAGAGPDPHSGLAHGRPAECAGDESPVSGVEFVRVHRIPDRHRLPAHSGRAQQGRDRGRTLSPHVDQASERAIRSRRHPACTSRSASPSPTTTWYTNPGDLTVGSLNLADSPAANHLVSGPDHPAPHRHHLHRRSRARRPPEHTRTRPQSPASPSSTGTQRAPDCRGDGYRQLLRVRPALTIVKDVNGQHESTPPGLYLPVGSPVAFTYLVTNTGNVATIVSVADSQLGTDGCPQTTLAVGASETCTAAGGTAALGPNQNTATATGQAIDDTGAAVGPPVTSNQDAANFFGAAPDITVVKDVNSQHQPTPPGLYIPVGDAVTFTYLVTNTGNVTLNPVTLDDNVLGPITCPDTVLAAGASETCTAAGGKATVGDHQNIAAATGQGVDNTGVPIGVPR